MPSQLYPPLFQPMQFIAMAISAALLSGCATSDRAVFVTKTSLSILDIDSTPPGVNVAYDRVEGFIGPAYQSGGAPPVVGVMKSDGTIINPHIRQIYATGNAARAISGTEAKDGEDTLSGEQKLMLYGTGTTIGLKFGIDATSTGNYIPNNFVFGYRRKEFSMLPLGKDKDAAGTYPSVLATIDNQAAAGVDPLGKQATGGLTTVQYFATGVAATELAKKLKDSFTSETNRIFSEKSVDENLVAQMAPIAKKYADATLVDKAKYDAAVSQDKNLGYKTFDEFLNDNIMNQAKLDRVIADLKTAKLP